jgi:hypothetical protein
VEMDGAAVADGEIEVVGGRVSRLKIAVGLDGASISGKVRYQDGEPSEGGAVYLFADSKEVKQTARIGRGDGAYTLKGIPPGKYRLVVPGPLDEFAAAKLFAAAEEIELHPGDKITKDLTDAKRQ